MTEDQGDSFNSSRAEVFEALGHPTRMRILQALSDRALGFSELKRETGIESNGLLAFHLGKLAGLVKLNSESSYALTDEGREALRIIEASRTQPEGHQGQRQAFHLPHQKAILAGLLVVLIVLGSVAVYQQSQVGSLSQEIASRTATVQGNQYWYLALPLKTVTAARSILFDDVNFTALDTTPCYIAGQCAVPNFVISFADGTNESFTPSPFLYQIVTCHLTPTTIPANGTATAQTSMACISASTTSYSLWLSQDTWLSQHTQPQAGFHFDNQDAALTFYVSVG